MNASYYFYKLLVKVFRNDEIMNKYYRRKGYKIGQNCHIYSNLLKCDSYLLEIGDNVTISSYVIFVTHDHSIKKVIPEMGNLFGKIIIKDNCFIGENSTILYGVTVNKNTIVAAGSVVTKSYSEENVI